MNDKIIPMFDPQCEVSQTTSSYNAFDIYLDEEIKDPTYYRHAFQVLRSAQRGDLVRLYISSHGGNLNSALIFKNCIEACEADVIAIIEAEAYSAASLIVLSCPGIEVKPYATMMLHSASFGSGGSVQNVRDHVEFTGRHAESLIEEVYADFISPDEMEDLRKGRELWFDYKQIGERLDAMFEARALKLEQGCDDPDCTDCNQESMPSIDSIIETAVASGVEQGLAAVLKKYDLVEKPKPEKKASRAKKPEVRSLPEVLKANRDLATEIFKDIEPGSTVDLNC